MHIELVDTRFHLVIAKYTVLIYRLLKFGFLIHVKSMQRISLLIPILLVMIGCSVRIAQVETKPVSQYNLYQEQKGLKVALDPFFEKERTRDYFGIDLLSHGIVPVHVVIENNHPNSGFLFDRRNFSILMKGENTEIKTETDPTIPEYHKVLDLNSEEERNLWQGLSSTGFVTGIVGTGLLAPRIVMIPVMIPTSAVAIVQLYDFKKEGDNIKINQNLIRKGFIDKTVFPKESHSGFLYFKVKDREAIKNVIAIIIKAKNTFTDEGLNFVFQIGKGGER